MNRPTTLSPEVTVTRPHPSWCTGKSCSIGEHETGMHSVAATAGGPLDEDDPGVFPTVGLGAWAYDGEGEPYVILALEHLDANTKMRPRELRRLGEVALAMADALQEQDGIAAPAVIIAETTVQVTA